MGLLILTLVGAVLGWLATIILRIEDGGRIVAHALVGIAGSLLAGLLGGNGSILGGVSGPTLAWATLGTLVALAAFNVLRRHVAR